MGKRSELFRELGLNSMWSRVRSVVELLRTIDEPSKADVAYGINTLLTHVRLVATPTAIETYNRVLPQANELYLERYDPEIDLEVLGRLPEGSLGREFARFIKHNNIKPLDAQFVQKAANNAIAYTFLRAYKLHDILHVALGLDTTIMGEVKIVAFSLGQSTTTHECGIGATRSSGTALAILFLHLAIKSPNQLGDAIENAYLWHKKGQNSPPHIIYRFEDHWHEKVEDVRSALQVA